MPTTKRYLENMGENIKLSRLRRNLSAQLVADRAGVSRATLCAVEKGSESVSIGVYAAVLHTLDGMDRDFELIAKEDEAGRRYQDMNLMIPKRARRRKI